MKLIDLQPRWVAIRAAGPRLGITFLCPHCLQTHLGVAFHHTGHEAMDDEIIRAQWPSGADGTGFGAHIWTLTGADDFETLTLSPSVDASASGHWHGFIKGGLIS